MEYNEQTYPVYVNLEQVFIDVSTLWSEGQEFRFINAHTEHPNIRNVIFRLTTTGDMFSTVFNSASYNGNTVISINRTEFERRASANFDALRRDGIISTTMSITEYAKMYLNQAILHEIGHALGLGHPRLSENILGDWGVLVPATNLPQRPTIMLSGTSREQNYMVALSSFLRRPVVIDDINVSSSDREAVRVLYSGGRASRFSKWYFTVCLSFLSCARK